MTWEALEAARGLALARPDEAALLVAAAAVALPLPDVDLWLIRLLHHRSVLTHSVLPPLLVLWGLPGLGPVAAAGVALGVAVHLAADLLSPSHGFGRVYLPAPFGRSLGRWSALWLMGNALAASWLAVALLPDGRAWGVLGLGVGAIAALAYGLRKERSLLSALVALAVVAVGHLPGGWPV